MSRRIPIDTTGRFYERTISDLNCCAICRQHRFIVVQKLSNCYAIHTYAVTPTNTAYCLHVWVTRDEDPSCLRSFKPTDYSISSRVAFGSLVQALKSKPIVPLRRADAVIQVDEEIAHLRRAAENLQAPNEVPARPFRRINFQ